MSLYMKQDFTPPLLSRRWIAIKFRPNMLVHSRQHIISILESGLLFREDSIEVEQEAPSPEEVWGAAGGGRGGWLTRGEGVLAAAALAVCVGLFPPRSFSRSSIINLSVYAAVPLVIRTSHRAMCRGPLSALLRCMRDNLALARRAAACLKEYAALHTQLDYLALARCAAACLKEYAALHTQLGSLSHVLEATRVLLCRQQRALCACMARASSALLGNAPWLRGDLAWHALERDHDDNLIKIHHAFLVVQSTLLKHIAMAHYVPPPTARRLYKNHNERLYWTHNTLIQHLFEEFKTNFESLERMYRLLKNAGTKDNSDSKKLGAALKDNWVYSEVHTGIARVCLELKLALSKSNGLDMVLDSCALNNQEIEMDVLNKDLDDLIDDITKCLTTVQNSQVRLKKLKGKFVDNVPKESDEVVESAAILKIDDTAPETKDEVFYFVKTEDDTLPTHPSEDVTAAPGDKEKETTKIVLNELKRKLGKREDLMRERERQALAKTMPELKNIPEFPRQIKFDEFMIKKGYISKIKLKDDKKRLFRCYKIKSKTNQNKIRKYKLKLESYVTDGDIKDEIYKANAFLNIKSKLITTSSLNNGIIINQWFKAKSKLIEQDSSDISETLSDAESSTAVNQSVTSNNQSVTQEVQLKFTKKDLEQSDSTSESDFEYYKNQRALLNDIRRHRVARKKNHPSQKRPIDNKDESLKPIDNVDESLKPIEYSFGAGLAMASVLQVNHPRFLNMALEENFIGDGEVSNDSGNDEDA